MKSTRDATRTETEPKDRGPSDEFISEPDDHRQAAKTEDHSNEVTRVAGPNQARWHGRNIVGLLMLVGVAAAAFSSLAVWFVMRPKPGQTQDEQHSAPTRVTGTDEGIPEDVTFPQAKWPVAGIRIEEIAYSDVTSSEWVTGKVALNEDRLAQIDPLVEGIVHDVKVQFGDEVQEGQVLAILDSREVGQAKLELFKNRQATRLAATEADWQQEIETNVQSLIDSLKDNIPISEIESRFADKLMGNYREQLVSAYARLYKSRADHKRLTNLSENGSVAGKVIIAAKATFEADQATLQALLEQIRFASRQSRLAADQTLDQARTAESISETNLRIMGLTEVAASQFDPTQEGESVSHYPVTAPFDGTIIQKDIALRERVGPMAQLFTIADLTTVWVTADIYERHMAMLPRLRDDNLRFRIAAYPDRMFEARVFSIGAVVNEQSRTLAISAIADNSESFLKPGMFVDVELPGERVATTLAIPTSALLDHQGNTFVFIHQADDRFVRRDVIVGRVFEDSLEIVAGLEAGDQIVTEGGFFLKSQMLETQFADED